MTHEQFSLNQMHGTAFTPSAPYDYAAFMEWRYDLIAEICERFSDEDREIDDE